MSSRITARAAGDGFLDQVRSANTRRAYATAVDKTTDRLGADRSLADVADEEIGDALETLWGEAAVNTWNARRAAVTSWLTWCREHGHPAPAVPAWSKLATPPDSTTPPPPRTGLAPGGTCTNFSIRTSRIAVRPARAWSS